MVPPALTVSLPDAPDAAIGSAVFERLPYGLLVTEPDGSVVAANPAAARLLGGPGAGAPLGRCCALLGCQEADGPLGGACLTERALALGAVLPEVRIDRLGPDGPRPLWVTAAPLGSGRAVLHLRAGRPGDRRRRSDSDWTAGPMLTLRVLGRTRVLTAEGPLTGPWLRQRPGLLLKLLVTNRRRVVPTDEIGTTLWPEAERTAAQNVRYCVHDLRGRLEPGREARSTSSFVAGHDGGYGLEHDRVHIDADLFEEHARRGLAALRGGETAAAREALAHAAALYEGEFLADEPYAEWAFAERQRLHELAGRVLDGLAGLALDQGEPEAAVAHLQRLADLEPLDAAVQRRLMALLLEQGRSGEALRRYKQAAAAWQATLGEPLDFRLADLRR